MAGLPAPGPRPPKAPGRKAVLMGGDCDGLVVRLAGEPPATLVVLVEAEGADPSVGYALATSAAPPPTAARPVTYVLNPFVGSPQVTRVATYVPESYAAKES